MSHPTYCSDGACTQGEHATSIPIGLTGALCASPPDYVRSNGEPRWRCGARLVSTPAWYDVEHCGGLVKAPGLRCAKHGGQRDEVSGARNDRARIRRLERERRTVQRKRIKAGLPPDAAPPMGPVVTTWQDAALISWWLDHGGLAALVGQ
jgi:hypothetical protein